jgi:hypothetical protein
VAISAALSSTVLNSSVWGLEVQDEGLCMSPLVAIVRALHGVDRGRRVRLAHAAYQQHSCASQQALPLHSWQSHNT